MDIDFAWLTYFDFCIFILHSGVILLLTYFLFDKVNVLQRKPSILCSGFVFVLNCKYCNICFTIDLMVFCPLWCENGRLIFVKKLQNRWPSIPKKKSFAKNPFIKAFIIFKPHFSRTWAYTWSRGHVICVHVHVKCAPPVATKEVCNRPYVVSGW